MIQRSNSQLSPVFGLTRLEVKSACEVHIYSNHTTGMHKPIICVIIGSLTALTRS